MIRTIATFCFLLATVSFLGQSKEEDQLRRDADTWFENNEFAKAFPLYSQLVSLHPQDADLNFRFGTSALYAGIEKEKSIKHLTFAVKKNCADPRVYFYLGKAFHLNYEFAEAKTNYQLYLKNKDPKDKNPLPAQRHIQMCNQGSQLLSNIKDVVVLEKTSASANDFYRYYELKEIGGRVITTPEDLLTKYDIKNNLVSVMHFPGNAVTIYFTSYGKDGKNGKDIYKADILPGGTFSTPERLPATINTIYDEDFAFMHPDGKSFYFASKGHNSMGGYDIFRCEFNPYTGQFEEPVNLDFAINTPDDDLFYVVDSLKETAYFASGRSSSQSELNVYKVMVQRIPVNLMFIAGDYFPEAANIGNKAKLRIIDELTGKTVVETIASKGAEGYLLDLPKAGLYKLELTPEGSAFGHTGTFEVPDFGRSVALKQELSVVDENGQQKLIITNSFNEALDMDLADLAADIIRRKSGLDVNATDELLEQLKEEESLREDLSENDLPSAAGFAGNVTLDEVRQINKQQREEWQEQAPLLESTAAALLDDANTYSNEAKALTEQAEALMNGVSKEDDTAYYNALIEYQELLLDAEDKKRAANNAVIAARELKAARTNMEAQADEWAKIDADINRAVEAGNMDDALASLTRFKELSDADHSTLPIVKQVREQAKTIGEDQTKLLERIAGLRTEENDLDARLSRTQKELELAKKKNVKKQLQLDVQQLQAEILSVSEEADKLSYQAILMGKEEADLLAQEQLYLNATLSPNSEELSFDETLAVTIETDLNELEKKMEVLAIDDPVTLAVLDERMKATRNDITILDKIPPSALPRGIEARSTMGARTDFTAEMGNINGSNVSPQIRTQYLKRREIERASAQLEALKNINRGNLNEELAASLDDEMQQTQSWIDELSADATTLETSADKVQTRSEAKNSAEKWMPSFQFTENNFEEGQDIEAWEANLKDRERLLDEVQQRIYENTEAIIQSDDAAEVASLNEEIQELEAIEDWALSKDPMSELESAWQDDLRFALENAPSGTEQLEAQAEVTREYLKGLDLLEEDYPNSVQSEALAEEKAKASQKLESYEQDLELALSTESEPGDNTVNNTTEALSGSITEATTDIADNTSTSSAATTAEDLQAQIDATDSFEEKERLQMEINKLKANEANTVVTEERAEMLEMAFEKPESVEVLSIRTNETFVLLESDVIKDASLDKEAESVKTLTGKIETLELEMLDAASDAKKRKQDKQIEKAYLDKAEAEIKISKEMSREARDRFADNDVAINAELENKEISEDLEKHLRRQLDNAQELLNEAEQIALEAAPDIDEIKQSYEYQRAVAAEVEALEIQNRVMRILDQSEEFATLEEEDQIALIQGRSITVQPEVDAENEQDLAEISATENIDPIISEEGQENNASSAEETANSTNLDEEPAVEATASESNTEPVVEEITEPVDTAPVAIDPVVAEVINTKPEIPEVRTFEVKNIETADVPRGDVLMDNWTNEEGLTPEMREAIVRNEAYIEYSQKRDRLDVMLSNRQNILDSRSAVVNDLTAIQNEIQALEAELTSGDLTEDEIAAKTEELKMLYRNAEVRYMEVTEAEERLANADANIEAASDALRNSYLMLNAAEIIAEARGDEFPESMAPEEVEVSPEETVVIPEEVVAAPVNPGFQQFLFAYPATINEAIFGFTDASPYSEGQPIPIDPVLPSGVIYKVQVGAFRNAIPQDLFSEFAPLAGEALQNGITRYTAGLFVDYTNANVAKSAIRDLGYSDAFVVAFRDGQRISLAEAREETDSLDALAEERISSSSVNTSTTAESNNPTESTNSVGTENPAAEVNTPSVSPEGPVETTVESEPLVEIAEFATSWESQEGSFYSVQIGVYSKKVSLADLYNVQDVMAERTASGYIRYTSGQFTDLDAANARKQAARDAGIADAFVVAYRDGVKVPVGSIQPTTQSEPVNQPTNNNDEAAPTQFELVIGTFQGEVPSEVALALLMLESKWGITQEQGANGTTYKTRKLTSQQELNAAQTDFQEYEVNVEIRELR